MSNQINLNIKINLEAILKKKIVYIFLFTLVHQLKYRIYTIKTNILVRLNRKTRKAGSVHVSEMIEKKNW